MELIAEVTSLLARTPTFRCAHCGDEKYSLGVNPTHDLQPAVTVPGQLFELLPPSHQRLLGLYNGMSLFYWDNGRSESGLRIFSWEEIISETKRLHALFSESMDQYKESSDFDGIDEWLMGLLAIGAPHCSGDMLVLDLSSPDHLGEYPVLFLDHEYYYSGYCEPSTCKVLAANVQDFLVQFLRDPVPILRPDWRYHDESGGQWYVEDVEFSSNAA